MSPAGTATAAAAGRAPTLACILDKLVIERELASRRPTGSYASRMTKPARCHAETVTQTTDTGHARRLAAVTLVAAERDATFILASGADLTFATQPAASSRGECQIQSSTRIQIGEWSFDSNIRKGARMLKSDHY